MSRHYTPPEPRAHQLASARQAAQIESLTAADRSGGTIWIFCVWCGHSSLVSPRWLLAQVEGAPDALDALEHRLTCQRCHRKGVRLIPTPRTLAAWDHQPGRPATTAE